MIEALFGGKIRPLALFLRPTDTRARCENGVCVSPERVSERDGARRVIGDSSYRSTLSLSRHA